MAVWHWFGQGQLTWRVVSGRYRFGDGIYPRLLDQDLTVEGELAYHSDEVSPEKTRGGRSSLPEKRGEVPVGPGTWEGHGGTQRVAANMMVGAVLPGAPPDDGEVGLLLPGLRRARMRTAQLFCCA